MSFPSKDLLETPSSPHSPANSLSGLPSNNKTRHSRPVLRCHSSTAQQTTALLKYLGRPSHLSFILSWCTQDIPNNKRIADTHPLGLSASEPT